MVELRQLGRSVLPPSVRFQLRRVAHGLGVQMDRARLWNWEHAWLAPGSAPRFAVEYLGRRSQRWQLAEVLGLDETPLDGEPAGVPRLLASEALLPGALRVPFHVDSIVRLGRSVDEILAGYHPELRRVLRKYGRRAATRRVVDEADIARVKRDMLDAFGSARHGERVVNLSLDAVRRLALETGRLDVVVLDGEEVACHLGYVIVHNGQRYWDGVRVGYPKAVYGDSRRFRVANSINTYLGICWAVANDFDYYSLGMSPARPEHGRLQYKRHRGGALTADFADAFFWLKLPGPSAELFWEAPLFSAQHGRLTLHLGLPVGPSDDEVLRRYRDMGFDGLSTVALHSARPASSTLRVRLAELYARHLEPPELIELAN